MTYLQRNRSGKGANVLYVTLASVIFIGVIHLLFPYFFPALLSSMARPFWRMQFSVISGSLMSPQKLLHEIETLKRQLADNELDMALVGEVEKENAELKALLGRASSTPRMLAAVLVRPPLSGYDSVIIDVGKDKKIASSSKVYVGGDILIGRIAEVYGETSKVLLFSSPGQQFHVLIGDDNVQAVAIGKGGGQFSAELPRDAKIREGDYIIVPELDSRPFARVSKIDSDPAEPFETIIFAPTVNIYSLRWVLVEANSNE